MPYILFRDKTPEDPEKPFFIYEENTFNEKTYINIDLEKFERIGEVGNMISGRAYLHKKPLSKEEIIEQIEWGKKYDKDDVEHAKGTLNHRIKQAEKQMEIYQKIEEGLE